jgi:hypothetical protein
MDSAASFKMKQFSIDAGIFFLVAAVVVAIAFGLNLAPGQKLTCHCWSCSCNK